jgi:ribosomal protein S1
MMYAAPTSETSRNGLVGQRLEFIVVEIKSRSVIVSRRAAMRKRSLERLRVAERSGEVLVGTVTNVLSYGAFIDLGGIEGLVHISEIADHWIENLHGILHSGMSVRVVVLQVDEQGERITLSMRQVLR